MVKFRKKSFAGQIFAVALIILWIIIEEKSGLSKGMSFLIAVISVAVIYIIFVALSEQIFSSNQANYDNSFDYSTKEKLESQIRQMSDTTEKKKMILKKTQNLNIRLFDLTSLIRNCNINDDEFWIELFVNNVNEISKTRANLVDFDGYLNKLSTTESRTKLKRILISKGVLDDEKLWW
jgi:replication initiation and membrane attachment protein DnaB